MRVIAGELKGRSLLAVPGNNTRPTTDKVKESIFNMIGPYFDGGRVLDLYAGTGALGIESLSRGMDRAIFIDRDSKAITIITNNLARLHLLTRSEVYRNDALRALKAISKRSLTFDLIFLDPPYAKQQIERDIGIINDYHLLCEGGKIVVECEAGLTLRDQIGEIHKTKEAQYGDTKIIIYEKDR